MDNKEDYAFLDNGIIICENLVKIYSIQSENHDIKVEIVALQGLDFLINSGEMVGIVGESGSGKTTLLNILGGLDKPSAGKVIVEGQNLLKLNEHEMNNYRACKTGFLWQQSIRNLVPYLNVLENVILPMQLISFPENDQYIRAKRLLDLVGLSSRLDHLPEQLSGGEQQRASIAVALANQPSILFADEPTGELDTKTSEDIYQLLKKINNEQGTTILIVSHDPEISRYVDRVVQIRDGKTSIETVKIETAEDQSEELEINFEELLMLDSAGRLQIPKPIMESLSIGSRLRLEVKDDAIVLHPVDGHRRIESKHNNEIFDRKDPVPNQEKTDLFSVISNWMKKKLRK